MVRQAYLIDEPEYEEFKLLIDDKFMTDPKASRIRASLIFKKLLEPTPIDKGWIVTGFPVTVLDMKRFDKMDTPPNKYV